MARETWIRMTPPANATRTPAPACQKSASHPFVGQELEHLLCTEQKK